MSHEHPVSLEHVAKTVDTHGEMLQHHDKILRGDASAYPPQPGMMHVLQGMVTTIQELNKGHNSHTDRIETIEMNDVKRVAWVKGAWWVIAGMGALIGFLLTEALHWVTKPH